VEWVTGRVEELKLCSIQQVLRGEVNGLKGDNGSVHPPLRINIAQVLFSLMIIYRKRLTYEKVIILV
jgi:hypothetical protein